VNDPPAWVETASTRARHRPMFRPRRAAELRRAARATGAHRKNVAAGTASSAFRFTVATKLRKLTPKR